MTYDINNDIERILMSEKDIEEAVTRISAEIDKYYANRDSRLLLL